MACLHVRGEDRSLLAQGRWAQRNRFGERPTVLLIGVRNYMAGERDRDQSMVPCRCGEAAWKLIGHLVEIVTASRLAGVPVIFTRLLIDPAIAGHRGAPGEGGGVFRTAATCFRSSIPALA